ncbi:MAG: 2-C-methyl-D-erythritol 2,4-cyclodiphosphate synthase [Firmicutes bacterium]|nr:2-C-methyl-D-erythritol 2,4-cyclodiphosphate synthase [Bacillota bacterium]
MRIGIGYDVHPLKADLPLVLGGVEIPFPRGLAGHSDADVLLHAIMDALLGAAALGDLGRHFPPDDSRYRGISSLFLLQEVAHLLAKKKYTVQNIDSIIIAQKPRLFPYLHAMRQKIAAALALEEDLVSIKATTTEKLGFTGEGKGIAAHAVVLLLKK